MKWFLYLPIHLLAMSVRWPLAWIAVKYFSTENKLQLQPWLNLFMTHDNPLSGDSDWLKHITGDSLSDSNRIEWLRRNGWNTLNYKVIGVEDSPWWRFGKDEHSKAFWLRDDGAWQWRLSLKIPFTKRVWTPYVGWGLFGPKHGLCKFTCTILRFNKIA